MRRYLKRMAPLVAGFGLLLGYPGASGAQENPVTAIDIALEPDATMIQHAEAANAILRKVFPTGYALDATHRPHITMLQRFVRTADLDKVYAAVGDVLAGEKPAGWTLEAFKYDYVVWDKAGLTVILIKHPVPTETDRCGCPLYRRDRYCCRVLHHAGRPRHQPAYDRLRDSLCAGL